VPKYIFVPISSTPSTPKSHLVLRAQQSGHLAHTLHARHTKLKHEGPAVSGTTSALASASIVLLAASQATIASFAPTRAPGVLQFEVLHAVRSAVANRKYGVVGAGAARRRQDARSIILKRARVNSH